ncbi:MAG: DUF1905 domain-containing protein, partial [Acidimicrobiales bacterium]
MTHRYRFTSPLWIWEASGEGSWHFVTLPEDVADEIKAITDGTVRRGFGSVRVEVTVGPTTWRTSVFPSKESGSYVLPVKKAVRTAAELDEGDAVPV